jgi:predicted secreted hydrolase
VVYWEGDVLAQGSHNGQAASGSGYVELVGYKMKIDL